MKMKTKKEQKLVTGSLIERTALYITIQSHNQLYRVYKNNLGKDVTLQNCYNSFEKDQKVEILVEIGVKKTKYISANLNKANCKITISDETENGFLNLKKFTDLEIENYT
ncbi:hypothetical protein DEH79_02295 [Mycoplasmopsis synoviae]|nr:hypothetical protein DEH79_02295 [Mycoplasmopsis synoviae]TNK91275.1 hypothetical protein C4M96_04510 [Mycoplasmopsis pullorum]QXV99803.1 hypothetical protein KXD88_02240 [Mycoplasmopsis synoviae]UBX97805.1 hypothetical protein K6989_03490 [Mycoplasmopsis synoviae]UBX98401.1 hypothetical protein K6987_00045 [Mycoplasmopsis synoviae]